MPTSRGGMLSLLLYVQQFNEGQLVIEPWPGDKPSDFNSAAWAWPDFEDDDEGEEGGAPFAWALLRLVARYLSEVEARAS